MAYQISSFIIHTFSPCILDDLIAKRAKILTGTLQNLVESFLVRVDAVITAVIGGVKARPQPHKMLMVLVQDVHQAHTDVMFGYPQPFGHLL